MTAGQQTQVANRQLVQLLSAWFQSRREASFAWSRAVSEYLALPALRGFWPMSSVDYTVANRARDLSGQGYHLTENGDPQFGYDNLAPCVFLDGTGDYLDRADGGAANWADVRGNESYILSTQRGLTFGAWTYFDNVAAVGEHVVTKWGAAGQRSYRINRIAAGLANCSISSDGTAIVSTVGSALAQDTWYHLVCRFIPSTSLDLFVNGVETSTVAGIPATVFDSTSSFNIGSNSIGALLQTGRDSMCFLCAAALSDAIILSLFEHTKAMFGVV